MAMMRLPVDMVRIYRSIRRPSLEKSIDNQPS